MYLYLMTQACRILYAHQVENIMRYILSTADGDVTIHHIDIQIDATSVISSNIPA